MFPGIPTGKDADQIVQKVMQETMPGIKTQAQFSAALASFDAIRLHVDAICRGDQEAIKATAEAVNKAIELVHRATALAKQTTDQDVAAKVDPQFSEPPKEFTEQSIMDSLMSELEVLPDVAHLDQWYRAAKDRFDRIVTQSLRNTLFDAVRAKRISLAKV